MQRYAEQLVHFSYSQANQHAHTQHAHLSGQVQTPPIPVPGPSASHPQPRADTASPSGPAKFMHMEMEEYREEGMEVETAAAVSQPQFTHLQEQQSSGGSRTPQVHPQYGPGDSSFASSTATSYAPPAQGQAPPETLDQHTRGAYRRSSSAYSVAASDVTSEAGTETDFEGSTDDEPTIRPGYRSDADSIYTDRDSIFTAEEGAEDDEESMAIGEGGLEELTGRGARMWEGQGQGEEEDGGDEGEGDAVGGRTPGEGIRARRERRGRRESNGDYRMMSP